MIIAGLGFATLVSPENLTALVRRAQHELGQAAEALAAPDFKQHASLRAAAHALGLPVLFIPRPALALAQPRCQTFSTRASTATGLASIAEACALAAAGAQSHLLLPRITQGRASCALAGCGT